MIRVNTFEQTSEVMEFMNKNNITKEEFWQMTWNGKQYVIMWQRVDNKSVEANN